MIYIFTDTTRMRMALHKVHEENHAHFGSYQPSTSAKELLEMLWSLENEAENMLKGFAL